MNLALNESTDSTARVANGFDVFHDCKFREMVCENALQLELIYTARQAADEDTSILRCLFIVFLEIARIDRKIWSRQRWLGLSTSRRFARWWRGNEWIKASTPSPRIVFGTLEGHVIRIEVDEKLKGVVGTKREREGEKSWFKYSFASNTGSARDMGWKKLISWIGTRRSAGTACILVEVLSKFSESSNAVPKQDRK
jgi:hypothetical protein